MREILIELLRFASAVSCFILGVYLMVALAFIVRGWM